MPFSLKHIAQWFGKKTPKPNLPQPKTAIDKSILVDGYDLAEDQSAFIKEMQQLWDFQEADLDQWRLEHPELDTCQFHQEKLIVGESEMYHDSMIPTMEYRYQQQQAFPNTNNYACWGSPMLNAQVEIPKTVPTKYCPICRQAELEWIENGGKKFE